MASNATLRNSTQIYPCTYTEAVLSPKFWRHCPHQTLHHPLSPFSENEKIPTYVFLHLKSIVSMGCQLCSGLDHETRRNEARWAESGGGVLGRGLAATLHLTMVIERLVWNHANLLTIPSLSVVLSCIASSLYGQWRQICTKPSMSVFLAHYICL